MLEQQQVRASLGEMADVIERVDKEIDRLFREMPEAKQKDVTGSVTLRLSITKKKDGYAVLASKVTTALPEESPRAQVLYEGEDGWLIDKKMDRSVPNQTLIPGTEGAPENVRPIRAAKAEGGKE